MDGNIAPFDWQRIFVGNYSFLYLLEIVFRTAFMYLYTLFAARLIGKRGMSQLTPFEFIIVIIFGSAVGDPMIYPDVPLLHGMTVVTIVVILQNFLEYATRKSNKIEAFVESTPTLLINRGKIDKVALRKEKLSISELYMQLRMKNIEDISDVKKAYLEPSGKISVFKSKTPVKKSSKKTFPKKV